MKQSNSHSAFAFPSACFRTDQSPGLSRLDHNIGTDSAFLTINPCYSHGGTSHNIQIDMESEEEEEEELFFDMDLSPAGCSTVWDSRQLTDMKREEEAENNDDYDAAEGEAKGQEEEVEVEEAGDEVEEAEEELYNAAADDNDDEFEFSMTWSEAGSMLISGYHYGILDHKDDCIRQYISPADDLFYKGQLLPLHLPPRIKMVEELSSCTIATAAESTNHADNLCSFDADLTKAVPDLIKDKPGLPLTCKHAIPSVAANCSRSTGQPAHGAPQGLAQRASMEADRNTSVTGKLCTPITSSWLDMQDPNVFPQCYQDSSLNLVRGGIACKSGQTSLKRYLPGIWRLRSNSSTDDNLSGPIESTELNASNTEGNIKQERWAAMSMFNLTGSGSVLRTFLFNGSANGQHHRMRIRRGGGGEEEPPRPSSNSNLKPSLDKELSVIGDTDHGFAAGIASHAPNCSSSSSYSSYSSSSSSSSSSTSSPSHTKQTGYMSIGRANQYLSKYAKIFKSVYVYVFSYSKESSATAADNHHDRHLKREMEALPLKSAASLSIPEKPKGQPFKATNSSSTFTKRLGKDLISCNNINHVFPRATNISLLSVPYCSSKRLASTEVDNGIQSAIAHCKRSSAQSSHPEDSLHPDGRTTINALQSSTQN